VIPGIQTQQKKLEGVILISLRNFFISYS